MSDVEYCARAWRSLYALARQWNYTRRRAALFALRHPLKVGLVAAQENPQTLTDTFGRSPPTKRPIRTTPS